MFASVALRVVIDDSAVVTLLVKANRLELIALSAESTYPLVVRCEVDIGVTPLIVPVKFLLPLTKIY